MLEIDSSVPGDASYTNAAQLFNSSSLGASFDGGISTTSQPSHVKAVFRLRRAGSECSSIAIATRRGSSAGDIYEAGSSLLSCSGPSVVFGNVCWNAPGQNRTKV